MRLCHITSVICTVPGIQSRSHDVPWSTCCQDAQGCFSSVGCVVQSQARPLKWLVPRRYPDPTCRYVLRFSQDASDSAPQVLLTNAFALSSYVAYQRFRSSLHVPPTIVTDTASHGCASLTVML